MKNKLNYRLIVWNHNTLIFEVLWMNEQFRTTERTKAHESANGIEIISATSPCLQISDERRVTAVYLQGTNKENNNYVSLVLVGDAEGERTRIILALEDWAKNWGGWKKEDDPKLDCDIISI